MHRVIEPPDDDFAYQSILAVWPLSSSALGETDWRARLEERLAGYLLKASREAKVRTSWSDPDANYEAALAAFVRGLIVEPGGAPFRDEMARLVSMVAPQALWNSLGRLVIHLMSPGVPDIYQGDELWYAALVDPDNRRPVDWDERQRALASAVDALTDEHREAALTTLREGMRAGELKMLVTRALLALRAELEGVESADFRMLPVQGARARNVVAFERKLASGTSVIVLAPRLTASVPWPQARDAWQDTRLATANATPTYRRVIHERTLPR